MELQRKYANWLFLQVNRSLKIGKFEKCSSVASVKLLREFPNIQKHSQIFDNPQHFLPISCILPILFALYIISNLIIFLSLLLNVKKRNIFVKVGSMSICHDPHSIIQVKRPASMVRIYGPEHAVDLSASLAK